ncbi:hypothetical protein NQT66_13155 [Cellulophaga baltica]|uniref:hypothetical protein n=1 Tax=Cellulophaga baltica TaxID=76594 RepID=UPI0021499210|nr:hypothetical protein [Cellulophaga baltica]MCR1025764.1 hypothetical protein [Cellulophaga baltica]
MNKYLIFLFLYSSFYSFSQPYLEYYSLINHSEIANLDGNHLQSDSLYNRAFKLVKRPFKEDYLLAAINADKLNNLEKVYNYLIEGIKNGLTIKRIKKTSFENFKKSKQCKLIRQRYETLHKQYLSTLNLKLRDEIIQMVKSDQKARRSILGSWKQMKKTDEYNYNRLLKIIEENNDEWPGFSLIGELIQNDKYSVEGNIAIVPLHFKKEWVRVLQPYMIDAVLHGEMYPYQYARIIDYKFYDSAAKTVIDENGKRQLALCNFYGTYTNVPICDCEVAEKEREKIGFEPLDDYYRKVKATYNCNK